LIVQWVRLLREGQVVKMSKRGGEFIPMEELLDEVGRDAARFFFLMRSPETPMDFDLDLAKLETNENPVYYVQYAHARICSLLDRAAAEGVELDSSEQPIDCSFLSHDKEEELMRRFAEFPHEVAEAAKNLEPQRITAYCRELATTFHAFYTECRVLGEEPQLTQARLALCRVTQQLLRRALKLLGVSAPRQM
jgi:arginyl-tRNA synthetase